MRYLFVHIAKTAGTSVNALFSEQLGPANCVTHVESRPEWFRHEETGDLLSGKQYISGHRQLVDFQSRLDLQDFFVFTFLREPCDHLVSHLAWIRRLSEAGEEERLGAHPEYIQDLSKKLADTDFTERGDLRKLLKGLAKNQRALLDNPQVRYLRAAGSGPLSTLDVQSAFHNLRAMNFFGLVESFDLDLVRLCGLAGIVAPKQAPRENARSGHAHGLSKDNDTLLEVLSPLIKFDLGLYRRAKKYKENSARDSKKRDFQFSSDQRVTGRIDFCSSQKIAGWARRPMGPAVCLDIYVDGKLVADVVADKHRKDLQEIFGVDCAFNFRFSEPLPSTASVSVKISGGQEDLVNSPYKLSGDE